MLNDEKEESITCTACRLSISGEERRIHYKSDLHRVNLKRKVSGLGPLTEGELMTRIQTLREQGESKGKEKQLCEVCRKKFCSRKALENHIKSKRHREALTRVDISEMDSESYIEETESIDEELERRLGEWEERAGMYSGVFDETWHESAEEALRYCREKFGLFLPYEEYVKDVDGLMKYVAQKVCVGYACLCCDRGFGSVDAVRRHMKDVGHCRMGEEWVEEFGEFYRWNEDEGWEEVVDEGNEEVEEVLEGMEIVERLDCGGDDDDVGLVIGDKIVGHRCLKRYYRQSGGRREDVREGIIANRKGIGNVGMIRWKGDGDKVVRKMEKEGLRRRQKFEVVVGGKNYYTRKARFKQKMAVFNSGYRA